MLTDERIEELWQGHLLTAFGTKTLINPTVFARAIEAEALQAQDGYRAYEDAVKKHNKTLDELKYAELAATAEAKRGDELQAKVAEQGAEIERLRAEIVRIKKELSFAYKTAEHNFAQYQHANDELQRKPAISSVAEAEIAKLRAEIERLTQKNAELREKLQDESAQHVQFMLHDHPKALAARDATIAQQVSEIETWRMRFYEADNHRITAASKVADQEQLKRTIEQQTERIAELERREFDWARSNAKCTDRIADQAALIEKCEKAFRRCPAFLHVKEALAAIAAQKGDVK